MLVICFILAQNRENFNSSGPYIPIQFQAVFYAGIIPAANTLPPFNTILSPSAKPCGADNLRACLYIYRRRRSSSSRRRRFPFSRRMRFHSHSTGDFDVNRLQDREQDFVPVATLGILYNILINAVILMKIKKSRGAQKILRAAAFSARYGPNLS